MKNVLYLMHTPWGWIKQRPHFLAEKLSLYCNVDLFYRKTNRLNSRNLNTEFTCGNLHVKGFRVIPFERFRSLDKINLSFVNNLFFSQASINWDKYDYIWLTEPTLYYYVRKRKGKAKIVYDCMDDALEFGYVKTYKKAYRDTFHNEMLLLKEADIVLCSSNYLRDKIQERYQINREIFIVNNAVNIYCPSEGISKSESSELSVNNLKKIKNPFVYIGTISEWFDFDLILRILIANPEINIVLVGPVRTGKIPQHERLLLMGAVDHTCVFDIMNIAKALIMPFKLTELIRSVNPVKLYEYIYAGKPIIAIKYGETKKFTSYVTLYSSFDEFDTFVKNVVNESYKQPSLEEMRSFVEGNTWDERCKIIKMILDQHNHRSDIQSKL